MVDHTSLGLGNNLVETNWIISVALVWVVKVSLLVGVCVCARACVANWRDVNFIHGFQACQLLKLLCKELGADFEIFAESFLPVSPSVP